MKYSVPAWLNDSKKDIRDWDILMPYQKASEPDLISNILDISNNLDSK